MNVLGWVMMPVLVLSGCQTMPATNGEALLDPDDRASHLQVEMAISQSLGVNRLVLARDAFARTSLLTLERRVALQLDKPSLADRAEGLPEQYRLLFRGKKPQSRICLLQRVRTGEFIPLIDVSCRPVNPLAR